MTRTALIALLACAIAAPGFGADAKPDAKKEDPQTAFDALPTKAKTAAKNQLNGGTLTDVKKAKDANGKEAWDISFTDKGGKKHEIEVTEQGSVLDKDKKDNKGYQAQPKVGK